MSKDVEDSKVVFNFKKCFKRGDLTPIGTLNRSGSSILRKIVFRQRVTFQSGNSCGDCDQS